MHKNRQKSQTGRSDREWPSSRLAVREPIPSKPALELPTRTQEYGLFCGFSALQPRKIYGSDSVSASTHSPRIFRILRIFLRDFL